MLLPVAMAAANALFDALRIPRQVVVDHQRTELQVDALGSGLGGDHDFALIAKIIHQRSTGVRAARTTHPVGAFVALNPLGVETPGDRVAIGAIEQHHIIGITVAREQGQQVFLGAARLCKDDGLLRGAEFL